MNDRTIGVFDVIVGQRVAAGGGRGVTGVRHVALRADAKTR